MILSEQLEIRDKLIRCLKDSFDHGLTTLFPDSVAEKRVITRAPYRLGCITMNHTRFWKTSTTSDTSSLDTFYSTEKVKNNSMSDSSDENLDEARKWLWKIISVVILAFGLTGNFLTILVFRKIGVSKRPTLFFLFVLAVTDSVVLLTGLSRYWILNTFELDIRTLSDFGCKINLFVIYLSMQYSSWILVFVCIERVIKTYLPLQFIRIVTYRRAYVSIIMLLFVLIGVDLHFFWTNGINKGECDSLTPEYHNFEEFVFVYVDFAFLSAVPFVIMFICNVLLVRALRRIQRSRESMMPDIMFRRTQRVSVKLTKMLLVSTFYFLVATVPVSVYFIVDSYRRHQYEDIDKNNVAILDFVWTITYLMQYSNYAVNFYLYSMVNDTFWSKIKIVCGCHKGIKRSRISLYTMRPTPTSSSKTSMTDAELTTNIESEINMTGIME